ncbi:hypothetical protein [Paenibacillus ottowii]
MTFIGHGIGLGFGYQIHPGAAEWVPLINPHKAGMIRGIQDHFWDVP